MSRFHALAAEAGPWRAFVLLLGYTGLRWGEATALRVCDIDLARRRIDVHRAFSDVGGHVVLGTPKSHQSRTVPIPRFLADEIAQAVLGKAPDDLVFTMPGGSMLRPANWRRAVFLSARARARISGRFRIHDLRHTAASLMIQASYPAEDAPGDPGTCQHHHDSRPVRPPLSRRHGSLRRPARQRGRRG